MKQLIRIMYFLIALMLTSCDWFSSGKNTNINIGIIIQQSNNGFNLGLLRGAQIAVNDINNQGGLLNRKIHLIPKYTKEDINEEIVIAEDLSQTKGILAVIGHLRSDSSIIVSSTYEQAKVLMITPSATSNLLTENERDYIFRMVPNNKDMGLVLTQYFLSQQLKNTIIFYPRREYGLDLANYFEKYASDAGINIVDRRSYFEQSGNYTDLLNFWKRNYTFDSILLLGDMPDGALILNEIRKAGITVPVIGAHTMANAQLIAEAGKNAENVVVLDFEDMEHWDNERLRSFRKKYLSLYKTEPEDNSILGFDSIMLLANAVKHTKSYDNKTVANYLHQSVYEGLKSKYQFDNKGNNIAFTKPYLKKVTQGVFKGFTLP